MVDADITAIVGSMGGNISTGLVVVFAALIIIVFAAILYFAGFLTIRKYKVHLFIPRLTGYETTEAKGRYLPNGRFEVFFGMMNGGKVEVEAPQETAIHANNIIFGYSPSKEEIYWITKMSIDTSHLMAEPTASPALRITYANGVKEINDRFSMQNQLKEYAVIGAILILGLVIALGNYFGHSKVADAQEKLAASYGHTAALLENASITIQRPAGSAPVSGSTTPTNVYVPPG